MASALVRFNEPKDPGQQQQQPQQALPGQQPQQPQLMLGPTGLPALVQAPLYPQQQPQQQYPAASPQQPISAAEAGALLSQAVLSGSPPSPGRASTFRAGDDSALRRDLTHTTTFRSEDLARQQTSEPPYNPAYATSAFSTTSIR